MVDAARQRPTTAHDTTERLARGANGTALDHTPAPVSGTPVLEVVVGAAFGAALGAAFGAGPFEHPATSAAAATRTRASRIGRTGRTGRTE